MGSGEVERWRGCRVIAETKSRVITTNPRGLHPTTTLGSLRSSPKRLYVDGIYRLAKRLTPSCVAFTGPSDEPRHSEGCARQGAPTFGEPKTVARAVVCSWTLSGNRYACAKESALSTLRRTYSVAGGREKLGHTCFSRRTFFSRTVDLSLLAFPVANKSRGRNPVPPRIPLRLDGKRFPPCSTPKFRPQRKSSSIPKLARRDLVLELSPTGATASPPPRT